MRPTQRLMKYELFFGEIAAALREHDVELSDSFKKAQCVAGWLPRVR